MHDHYSMYASFFTCELDRVDAATMETMRQSRHLDGYHSSKGWVPKLGTWGLTAMLILYYTIGNGNPPGGGKNALSIFENGSESV